LFARSCAFLRGVVRVADLPPVDRPEVAFAGRSNVGKSSLINALTGRRTLARTSNTPGRTREINFFSLDDRLVLVDLPGYGYARAAKTQIMEWTRVQRNYLKGRPTLRRLCLLVDARHGVKDSDRELMSLLDDAAVPFQIVLTKADKPKGSDLAQVMADARMELRRHPAGIPEIIPTSARTGQGIPALRAALAALAAPA